MGGAYGRPARKVRPDGRPSPCAETRPGALSSPPPTPFTVKPPSRALPLPIPLPSPRLGRSGSWDFSGRAGVAEMQTSHIKHEVGALRALGSLLWGVPCPFLPPCPLCCPPPAPYPPPRPRFLPHSPSFSGGAGCLPTLSPQGTQLPPQPAHLARTPNEDQPRPQSTFQTLLRSSAHTAHGVCIISCLPLGLASLPAPWGFVPSVFLCLPGIAGHTAERGASGGGGASCRRWAQSCTSGTAQSASPRRRRNWGREEG